MIKNPISTRRIANDILAEHKSLTPDQNKIAKLNRQFAVLSIVQGVTLGFACIVVGAAGHALIASLSTDEDTEDED